MNTRDTGYILQAAGCVPYAITKEEYEAFIDSMGENRTEKVKEDIYRLKDAIGVGLTKSVIRDILKEIED